MVVTAGGSRRPAAGPVGRFAPGVTRGAVIFYRPAFFERMAQVGKLYADRGLNPPAPRLGQTDTATRARRGFLRRGLLFLFGGGLLFGRRATAAPANESGDPRLVTEGATLKTLVRQGQPPVEPLDTVILFERADDNHGRAETHEVLSLIHEERGPNSYPWTLYAEQTSHQLNGDAVVLCSRLIKKGAGWAAGHHSEVFSHARGVAIGLNVEMSNYYTGPEATEVIGVNIQPTHGPRPSQYGLQIQEGQGGRVQFEKAIGLNGGGAVGVDLAGHFKEAGIHLHDNALRLNEGASIELDGAGQVRVRYRNGRIEFMNGNRCVGHINMRGSDHEM